MINTKSLNIYIVDDDKIFHFTTEKFLEAACPGCNIQSFYNGEEALNQLQQHLQNSLLLPDIIFLDINMPIMNGWEFLEGFEKVASQLPKEIDVYMVSSSADEQDVTRAASIKHLKAYITKPIAREKFEEIVSNIEA